MLHFYSTTFGILCQWFLEDIFLAQPTVAFCKALAQAKLALTAVAVFSAKLRFALYKAVTPFGRDCRRGAKALPLHSARN